MQAERPSIDQRRRTRWAWLVIPLVGVLAAAAGGVLLRPRSQPDFGEQVERAVSAGVPTGTPATQAHQWIKNNPAADDVIEYGPANLPLQRLHGRSAAECAGVPPGGLRKVICFRVRHRSGLGLVTDQAWVYLLVAEDGLIRGRHVTTDDPPPMPTYSYSPPPAKPWWQFW